MIRLTIVVDDISSVMSLFTHVRLYTSTEEAGTYAYLDDVLLVSGQSTYYYSHVTGTSDTWYKSSYYNTNTSLESSLSAAVQGVSAVLYHYATYPEEISFDNSEDDIITKVRRLTGDFRGLGRLYLSDEDTSCQYLHEDGKTIEIKEKGWPVYITTQYTGEDAVEKTSSSDPVVQGYKQLTFANPVVSGTMPIVDIWYYTFKFSDVEVYEAYEHAFVPPRVPSDSVTQDHLVLQAAIDLLENMTSEDMTEDGATIRDDQTLYDPGPGLKERDKTIKRLQKRLDDLIEETIYSLMIGVTGVLID